MFKQRPACILCALTERRSTTDKAHTFSSFERRARRWTVDCGTPVRAKHSVAHIYILHSTSILDIIYRFLCPQSQCCTLYHHYNTIYRAEDKYNRYLKSDIFNWGVISLIMSTFQHSSKTIHPGFVYMLWPEENCKDDTFDINC